MSANQEAAGAAGAQQAAGAPPDGLLTIFNPNNQSEMELLVNVTREYPFDYALVMFGYIMPLVLVITIITNTLVVMVLAQRHMRTPTNIVLFAMAIVDLMTLLSPSPWYFYIYTLGFYDKYLYPPVACYWHHIMTDVIPVFFHTSSIWLALLLASQRYIYVCHPTLARTWCTVPRVRKAIVLIILVALLHQSARFFDSSFVSVEFLYKGTQFQACKMDNANWLLNYLEIYYSTYFTFRIFFVFIIPIVSLITLNYLLFRALRRAKNKRTELLKTKFKLVECGASGATGTHNFATSNSIANFGETNRFEASSYFVAAAAAAPTTTLSPLPPATDHLQLRSSVINLDKMAPLVDKPAGGGQQRRQGEQVSCEAAAANDIDCSNDEDDDGDEDDEEEEDDEDEENESDEDFDEELSRWSDKDEDDSTCFECNACREEQPNECQHCFSAATRDGAASAASADRPAGEPQCLSPANGGDSSAAATAATNNTTTTREEDDVLATESASIREDGDEEFGSNEQTASETGGRRQVASGGGSCNTKSRRSLKRLRHKPPRPDCDGGVVAAAAVRQPPHKPITKSRARKRRTKSAGGGKPAPTCCGGSGRTTCVECNEKLDVFKRDEGRVCGAAGRAELLRLTLSSCARDKGERELEPAAATTLGSAAHANSTSSLLQVNKSALRNHVDETSRPHSVIGVSGACRMKSPSLASSTLCGRGSRATLLGAGGGGGGPFATGNSTSFGAPQPPPQHTVSATPTSTRHIDSSRTTLMLVVVVTVFLMVEVPVATVTILHVLLNTFDIFKGIDLHASLDYIKLFTNFFIMISYSVNFTIYCSMSKKFRETFRDLFSNERSKGRRATTNNQPSGWNNNTQLQSAGAFNVQPNLNSSFRAQGGGGAASFAAISRHSLAAPSGGGGCEFVAAAATLRPPPAPHFARNSRKAQL